MAAIVHYRNDNKLNTNNKLKQQNKNECCRRCLWASSSQGGC